MHYFLSPPNSYPFSLSLAFFSGLRFIGEGGGRLLPQLYKRHSFGEMQQGPPPPPPSSLLKQVCLSCHSASSFHRERQPGTDWAKLKEDSLVSFTCPPASRRGGRAGRGVATGPGWPANHLRFLTAADRSPFPTLRHWTLWCPSRFPGRIGKAQWHQSFESTCYLGSNQLQLGIN